MVNNTTVDMQRLLEAAKIKPINLGKAKDAWLMFRQARGYKSYTPLLSPEANNLKFQKSGKKFEFKTYGLSLAPASTSQNYNLCRYATGCADICVAHTGNGKYHSVEQARIIKTWFLAQNPSAFITILDAEIEAARDKHKEIALRLNTFSDLKWEKIAPWLLNKPGVHLYDYTKWPAHQRPEVAGYDLTRSATEKQSKAHIKGMLDQGHRVAVCLDIKKSDPIPLTYLGHKCVDGDEHDARFVEDKGVVVVLRPKGSARKAGFARALA